MDADGVAVDAADGFANGFAGGRATVVAENELVRGEGDGFANGVGRKTFSEGGCSGGGGAFRARLENGLTELVDPGVVGLAIAEGTGEQIVLVEEFGKDFARLGVGGGLAPIFGFDAVTDGLTKHRRGLFLADQPEQIPGAIRKNDAVDFRVVVNGVEETVEGVIGRAIGEGRERLFGLGELFAADQIAHFFASERFAIEWRRGHGMEDFVFASASFLDAVGVAVKDFEDGESLRLGRQLLRHVPGGRQRHQGVKADVIFAAEGAGVGEDASLEQRAQGNAGAEFFGELGKNLVGGRFLHQADEGLDGAEVKGVRTFRGVRGREAKFGGRLDANGGDEHAAADIGKEFAAAILRFHGRRRILIVKAASGLYAVIRRCGRRSRANDGTANYETCRESVLYSKALGNPRRQDMEFNTDVNQMTLNEKAERARRLLKELLLIMETEPDRNWISGVSSALAWLDRGDIAVGFERAKATYRAMNGGMGTFSDYCVHRESFEERVKANRRLDQIRDGLWDLFEGSSIAE